MSNRLLIATLVLVAAPAGAQDRPAAQPMPSVEQYLCTFAGKCDGAAQGTQATRDAPATKGFRLARPTAQQPRSPARTSVLPTRSGSRALVSRPRSSGDVAGRSRLTRAFAPATAAASPTLATRPRADLMIGFELNSAQLSAEGVNAAQVFARSLLMPELSRKRFLIEGHTDLRGGRALNRTLSAKRAQAVADYLVILGVSRERLQTRGLGADAPLPGKRVSDPINRRVEAELIS